MIPIIKGNEPKALTEAKRDIQNTPDASFDYSSLRGEHKRKVLEALIVEQGHLCAYCMCRIGTNDNPATIEHITSQHPATSCFDRDLSLSYKNMLAVCDGRSGATCDKRRGNEPLTVNPLKPETLATITYHHDGRIHADDPDINHDLNDTLGLNSSKTNLCANRAAAMQAMEQTILKSIARKRIDGKSTAKKEPMLKDSQTIRKPNRQERRIPRGKTLQSSQVCCEVFRIAVMQTSVCSSTPIVDASRLGQISPKAGAGGRRFTTRRSCRDSWCKRSGSGWL